MTKKNLNSAAAATAKFFSESDTQDQDKKPKKEQKKDAVKAVKKVFSFRASAANVDSWRLYATAAGIKVDDLGDRALTEYIERHPLNDVQQAFFDSQIKKIKS